MRAVAIEVARVLIVRTHEIRDFLDEQISFDHGKFPSSFHVFDCNDCELMTSLKLETSSFLAMD